MRLRIDHQTRFRYEGPASALVQLRLHAQTGPTQSVGDWSLDLEGATRQARFIDPHGSQVDLVELDPGADGMTLHVRGTVDTHSRDGVYGPHTGHVPLWLYRRSTDLTAPDPAITALAQSVSGNGLDALHALSRSILSSVPYTTGTTGTATRAADALAQGQGVCQDHAHLFLACARTLGFPARYVSGYLMMTDRVDQEASHAWAEAHLDGLGWVGFDVSNGVSPDERHVRLACGLDYADCAPTRGLITGRGQEQLEVSIQVQQ